VYHENGCRTQQEKKRFFDYISGTFLVFVLVNRLAFSHLARVSVLENPVRFTRSTSRAVAFGWNAFWHHAIDHAPVPDLIIGTHLFFMHVSARKS
jgi:hypothetical protein